MNQETRKNKQDHKDKLHLEHESQPAASSNHCCEKSANNERMQLSLETSKIYCSLSVSMTNTKYFINTTWRITPHPIANNNKHEQPACVHNMYGLVGCSDSHSRLTKLTDTPFRRPPSSTPRGSPLSAGGGRTGSGRSCAWPPARRR